jgi:hypothetical protein
MQNRGATRVDGQIDMLVMHAPNASRFEGQIDNQGTIRGQVGGYICMWTYVRKKRARKLPYPPNQRLMRSTTTSTKP